MRTHARATEVAMAADWREQLYYDCCRATEVMNTVSTLWTVLSREDQTQSCVEAVVGPAPCHGVLLSVLRYRAPNFDGNYRQHCAVERRGRSRSTSSAIV